MRARCRMVVSNARGRGEDGEVWFSGGAKVGTCFGGPVPLTHFYTRSCLECASLRYADLGGAVPPAALVTAQYSTTNISDIVETALHETDRTLGMAKEVVTTQGHSATVGPRTAATGTAGAIDS